VRIVVVFRVLSRTICPESARRRLPLMVGRRLPQGSSLPCSALLRCRGCSHPIHPSDCGLPSSDVYPNMQLGIL
jgi:hypothetical protein